MKDKSCPSQFHNRLWLLLLLPYLLWSVIGSAPHLHALNGSEISWWNVVSTPAQHSAQSSIGSHQQSYEPNTHVHLATSDAPCLLCQWSSHASSLSTITRVHAVLNEQSAAFAAISPFLISRVIHNAANRGPPLS